MFVATKEHIRNAFFFFLKGVSTRISATSIQRTWMKEVAESWFSWFKTGNLEDGAKARSSETTRFGWFVSKFCPLWLWKFNANWRWLKNGFRTTCLQRIADNVSIVASHVLHDNFKGHFGNRRLVTSDEKWILYHNFKRRLRKQICSATEWT